MGETEIAALVRNGDLRAVRPDPETAQGELSVARRHVESAELLVEVDPTLAFVALYDAMRKAISAHMRSAGYRIAGGPGQHVKTGRYALAALDHLDIGAHLAEFNALRDLRNQSEYDALWVQPEDVHAAAEHAIAILDAVIADLGSG